MPGGHVQALRGRGAWAVWGATLAVVATVLVHYRPLLGQRQAPVTLVFLLIILLGSVSGGRALGLALSGVGFAVLNYHFQRPYEQWGISDPADWTGPALTALLGTGDNVLDPTSGHLRKGLLSPRLADGVLQEAAMDPSINFGVRKDITRADLAVLQDIGWATVPIPEPSAATLVLGLTTVAASLRRRRRR